MGRFGRDERFAGGGSPDRDAMPAQVVFGGGQRQVRAQEPVVAQGGEVVVRRDEFGRGETGSGRMAGQGEDAADRSGHRPPA
ncbi:hypothetical protein [Glycomyces tarimensis]